MRFNFFQDFLALVFPKTCCICKRSLFDFEVELCQVCIGLLPVTNYHLRPQNNDLVVKIMGLTKCSNVMSFLRFSKKGMSQKLLHQLKYKNKPEIGLTLGKLYAYHLSGSGIIFNWDLIIPVPLHPMKLKRRGYNQSERFGMGLSEVLKIPIFNALTRDHYTETQTKKSRIERISNTSGVFKSTEPNQIFGKRILIVDDVMTTGATLASCANALLEAGALNVDLAVIAAGK